MRRGPRCRGGVGNPVGGGVGNPVGGALGILAIAALLNMLDLTAISPFFTDIFVGLLLLGALYLDRLRGGDSYE